MREVEIITIVCTFSRLWAIDGWLRCLATVDHDPAATNLVFVIDGDEPIIKSQLEALHRDKGYRSLHLEMNKDWEPNEVRLAIRRKRIADVKEQTKHLVARCDGEFVISLEDDTVFDRLGSFDRLLLPFRQHANIGFVQGVQIGRWGVRMVGAWKFDDVTNPTRVETMLPPEWAREFVEMDKTTEEITAGGWYGYATRKHHYLDAVYHWDESQPWGPDVNFGLWLSSRGYKCLIDWSILYGHNDHGPIGWPDSEPLSQVFFQRDEQTGQWIREDRDETISRY